MSSTTVAKAELGVSHDVSIVRDLIALAKPRVTLLNMIIAVFGMFMAPQRPDLVTMLLAVLGIACAVASANTLNMVWERDTDGLMKRTADRPLPSGRLSVVPAAISGVVLAIVSMAFLILGVNGLPALLAGAAIVPYAFVYTPLKRITPLALLSGAVPGAAPPLLGWTAATGTIDGGGLTLFLILLVWQLPHFLAITLYLKSDYERAGIRTVSTVRGDQAAKVQALAYATLLIPVSLLPVSFGLGGWVYISIALALGVWFWSIGLKGLRPRSGARWARRFFLASLLYLPALMAVLMVDAIL